jgi:carboxymethylenebutenolidase
MMEAQPEGFLAQPGSDNGPGVLVLHAWWGLNDTTRAVCTRLAEEGFTAFAPDLYHGKIADTIPGAEALASALDEEQAKADLAHALEYLERQAARSDGGFAVVGFSLGAFFAIELSTTDPEMIHSVVLFYGTGMGEFNKSKAAYLGHFAEEDEYEPPDAVEWLEGELEKAGLPFEFYQYPGTGHWFFEPDRVDAYHQSAADLAWERTLDFLNKNFAR